MHLHTCQYSGLDMYQVSWILFVSNYVCKMCQKLGFPKYGHIIDIGIYNIGKCNLTKPLL